MLSFATSLHKCQGLTIGPSTDTVATAAPSMIVDIGSRTFEQKAPGLVYTALSRVTTLGSGDRSTSALFFTGNNVTQERLVRMTYKKNTDIKTINVLRRDAWIALLKSNTHDGNMTKSERRRIFHWASHTRSSKKDLMLRIESDPRTSHVP